MHDADTIAAISSPIGEGGIGIVRMSGPAAHSILRKIFRPRKPVRRYLSHRLYLGFLCEPEKGTDVDEVFCVIMDRPRTYTREDVAEVYCHGGLIAQRQILSVMLKAGARLAEPGEFTKRAFLNGRIDLSQAESVLDVIESESALELETALSHVKGRLSEQVQEIRTEVRRLLAEVEAEIDFPEEELSFGAADPSRRLDALRGRVAAIVSSYYEGRTIRSGFSVLILGKSNVGKSSLLNALALDEKAIVTALPGTTRDLVEDTIHVKGIKLKVTDTAGLRETTDPIEKEGIKRVMSRIPEADVVLWVLDGSTAYSTEDERVYREIGDRKTIAVINKIDLTPKIDDGEIRSKGLSPVRVSALTGACVDGLKECLYEAFADSGHKPSGIVVTNVRHRDALQRMGAALHRAEVAWAGKNNLEFVAFELRDALHHLGEITGETCTEEVLGEIFSRFCIGK